MENSVNLLDKKYNSTQLGINRSESILSLESIEFCQVVEDFLENEMTNHKLKKRLYYGKYRLVKKNDNLINNHCICAICLECYTPGTYKRILNCGHVFHKKCIDRWFRRLDDDVMELKCPVCRNGNQSSIN